MKLLLYCNKSKPYLVYHREYCALSPTEYIEHGYETRWEDKRMLEDICNGNIVAECDYEVEEIENTIIITAGTYHCGLSTNKLNEEELFKHSCLSRYEMFNYLKHGFSKKEPRGKAIHIKNLHIFDKPRELSDYITKQCQFGKCSTCKYGKNDIHCATIDTPITKAPQNMMYAYDEKRNKYVLISIHPQWLCKILNGEKTVEVRKVVLKEM